MPAVSKVAIIQQMRRRNDAAIAELRAQIAKLEADNQDLDTAERVLVSLSGKGGEVGPVNIAKVETPKWETTRGPKPEGTPTVPDMIIAVLRDAKKAMEPKEIAAEIAKRWWPDVTLNAVGPIAWRMHKRDNLSKRGSKYSLPKDASKKGEGPDGETSEPSSNQSGDGVVRTGPSSSFQSEGATPSVSTSSRRDLFASAAIPSARVPH